jgi:lipopolysaccharide transport system ATP-binding protein
VRITISTHLGIPVFAQSNRLSGRHFEDLPERGTLICRIPRLPLTEGTYFLSYKISAQTNAATPLDRLKNAAELQVINGNFYGTGRAPVGRESLVLVEGEWRLDTATPTAATLDQTNGI